MYLSCKLAETPRRIRDIVSIVVFLEWLEKKDRCLETLRKKESDDNISDQFVVHEERSIDGVSSEGADSNRIDQISTVLRTLEKELKLPDLNSKVRHLLNFIS